MRFADFEMGQIITVGPRLVSQEEIIAFASQFDPQQFHTDLDAASKGRWNGLIASGWHTCALAMRMVCDSALLQSESFGSPGLAYVRWNYPVRPGDELTLKCEVLEVRRSRGQALIGVLRWRWVLFNQNGNGVLELEATSLFDLSEKREDQKIERTHHA